MSKIQDNLGLILEKLERMEKTLSRMEERLINMEKVVPACERMDDHVTFVNGVYTTVKAPIEYVCSAFTEQIQNFQCKCTQEHVWRMRNSGK